MTPLSEVFGPAERAPVAFAQTDSASRFRPRAPVGPTGRTGRLGETWTSKALFHRTTRPRMRE